MYFLLGDLLAIGYYPACAVTFRGFPEPGTDPVERELSRRHGVAPLPGLPNEVSEQLAECRPDLIVDSSFRQDTETGRRLARIAPVLRVNTDWDRRPTDPSKIWTRWKEILWNTADGLGELARSRAAGVIEDMERRATALRGQVGGKSFGSIDIASPASWIMYGPYVNGNGTMPMSVDLGMNSVVVPDSIGYSNSPAEGCFKGGFDREGRPTICSAVGLSPELFGVLEPAEMILNAYGSLRPDVLEQSLRNPLFQSLPAVKAGRFVQGAQWSWSVFGAASVYSAVARAFGIDEYYAIPGGWNGTRASLALDEMKARVCWAVTVRPGHATPSRPIVLSVRKQGTEQLTLTAAPDYKDIDASVAADDVPPWRRASRIQSSTGCASVPASFEVRRLKSADALQLDVGYGAARLERGAPALGPPAW